MDEHCKRDANKRVLMIHSWDPNVGRETGGRLTLVAARFPEADAAEHRPGEHRPGAINILHRDMEAAATKAIDRSSTAVIDGDGLGRHASTNEALSMAMLGCTVKALTGGLDWWRRDVWCGREATGGRLSLWRVKS